MYILKLYSKHNNYMSFITYFEIDESETHVLTRQSSPNSGTFPQTYFWTNKTAPTPFHCS